jgi:Protein of unknown function (DUF3352)
MTDFERPSTDPTPGQPAAVPPTPEPASPPPGSPPPTTPPTPASMTGVETETTAHPVPTQPILAPEAWTTAPKPNRTRWFVAAGAIALVILATTLITLSLTASAPSSAVLGYVPADSTMYGEVRLDLPGDQRQKLGQFLSKFPGFADQAALDTKLDEVLDRLTSESTDGKQRFTTDIKPWFDGQLAFSIGPIPEMTGEDRSAMAKAFRGLLLISVKDEALARSWFSKAFADAGITSTTESYQGTDLTLFSDPKTPGLQAGFGVVGGKVAIVGDATSVKAAVDTKGSSGLAKAPTFAAAEGALKGDDVGFMYFDMKAFMDASMKMSQSLASAPPVSDALLASVPEWVAMRLRVEGDALLLDSAAAHVEGLGPTDNHPNGVAAFAPPSTVAMASGNDYGATLKKLFAVYRTEPTTAEGFKQIDEAAGLIGGLDAAVEWMGDSGIVVAQSGETVEGGIVSIPADAAAGQRLLTQLRTFIQLGGQQAGVTIRDETYNGQTITIVDLGSFRDLAAMAGSMGGLPADPGALPDGHAEIAYVATDQVVVIGSSPDFVKHVLDAGAGASLADDARFQGLVARVDTNHTALNYVDITAIRQLVEGALANASAEDRAEYEESIKPFLVPFDALIASGAVGTTADQGRGVITVK